jgi:hypothetical protein
MFIRYSKHEWVRSLPLLLVVSFLCPVVYLYLIIQHTSS